jgi:predicted metal-dependent peptidase
LTHRRRSKKQPPGDDQPLLHGRITVQPHAVVIVDTSMSMMTTDIQARALSVIGQGLRKLGRVKVYCADTKVQSHATVTNAKRFDWHGGGGTDMATALMEVDKSDHPDSIILITDAETYWSSDKPNARVVVAYTGKKDSTWHKAIPSWCRTVPLKQEA